MPPVIDKEKCDGCGLCLFHCGADVYSFNPEAYQARVAKPAACVDCFICTACCPREAIRIAIRRQQVQA